MQELSSRKLFWALGLLLGLCYISLLSLMLMFPIIPKVYCYLRSIRGYAAWFWGCLFPLVVLPYSSMFILNFIDKLPSVNGKIYDFLNDF